MGDLPEHLAMDSWDGILPDSLQERRRLYHQHASFLHGLVREKRGLIEKITEWHLRSGNDRLPERVSGWIAHREDE